MDEIVQKATSIQMNRMSPSSFYFFYFGLRLEVKNRFISLVNERDALEKKLSHIILEGDQRDRGLDESGFGIESVNSLCEKEGGRFQFGLEGEEWVSRVFLPRPVSESPSFKKAA